MVKWGGAFLLAIFLFSHGLASDLPSSVSLSYSLDNDSNQFTTLDFDVGTNLYAMISMGTSFSSLQFAEDEKGENRSYYFGVQSNPLRDWIFGGRMTYTEVSNQMRIHDPSIFVMSYFKHFNARMDVGYRIIKTQITSALGTLLNIQDSEIEDENFWWSLSTNVNLSKKFTIGMAYRQFQYSTRFQFFNSSNVASLLGYTYDTINYGASFPDYIFSMNGTLYHRDWDFTLDYSFVENEFDDSENYIWTPAVGYRLNDYWYFNGSFGMSRGITEEEDDTTGHFFSFGGSYTW